MTPTRVPQPEADPEEAGAVGRLIYELARRLYPLPRSITGDGTRETLRILSEYVPLEIHEIPTGTPAMYDNDIRYDGIGFGGADRQLA